jgi:hypothetical protein
MERLLLEEILLGILGNFMDTNFMGELESLAPDT